MGGNYIEVTFWCRGEYISTVYTYDEFDIWQSNPLVIKITDEETGEVLFRK